jgi:hypothetical protein
MHFSEARNCSLACAFVRHCFLCTYLFNTYTYVCVCVCVYVRQFPSLSQPYQRLSPLTPLECTGENSSTARRAAITRVRGGANLNCTVQLRAIFSHPCTAYQQLEFCVQSLLERLCKHANFQARFRPDKPDHSLVRFDVVFLSHARQMPG